MSYSQLAKFAALVWSYFLDTLAPPDPLIREIENMGADGLLINAGNLNSRERIEGVISLLPYENHYVRAAILEVKSYGNRKISDILGKAAYELLVVELSELETFDNFRSPILIPVPITKKRRRSRGFNQCEIFLKSLQKAAPDIFEIRSDLLVKLKETEDQVGKTRAERLKNINGSFSLSDDKALKGRNVIIFDDIVTTGATLLEAKRALRLAFPKKIICVALAH